MSNYIPQYAQQYLPEYGFGDWLKKGGGRAVLGGLGVVAGGVLTATGIGAGVGVPLMMVGGQQLAGGIEDIQESNQMEEAASQQEMLLQQQRYASNRQRAFQSAQQRFQQAQADQATGMQQFQQGGGLTPLTPRRAGTLPTQRLPERNLSFGPNRVNQMYRARLFGNANDPLNQYFNAVERPLTDTTQRFIYDRTGTTNPEEAAIRETLATPPREFFTTGQSGVSRLIPTTQIDPERAADAQQFLSDMYGRGQIKFRGGGRLPGKRYADGGGLERYNGQTHEGPNGGIPVDENGVPSVQSNQKPVGLVEDGEVSYTFPDGNVYIFSNKLKYE